MFHQEYAAKIDENFQLQKYFGYFFQLMCKIIPRIKELVLKEGITIGALERQIGASKGVLSRAIANGTDIQSKWLVAIVENYPQYSAQWLLTGIGDMSNNNDYTATGPTSPYHQIQQNTSDTSAFVSAITSLNDTIREQAEEIGRLKECIRQLTVEKEKHVSPADINSTANVG